MINSELKKLEIGLLNGLCGEVLLDFLMAEKTGENSIRNEAESKLAVLADALADCSDYTFESGISGIGWTIEFITQRRLLIANTDEVLESVDDNCYIASLNCCFNESKHNIKYVLGLINYHQIRANSRNKGREFYKYFIHRECLMLLSRILTGYLAKQTDLLTQKRMSASRLIEFSYVLLKVSHLISLIEKPFEKPFYVAVSAVIDLFKRLNYNNQSRQKCLKYTKSCLVVLIAVKKYGNPVWEKTFEEIYYKMLRRLECDQKEGSDALKKIHMIEKVYSQAKIGASDLKAMRKIDSEFLIAYLSAC